MAGRVTWQRYRRSGRVQAERLTAPLRWRTEGGDVLTGQPGDWRVTDGRRTWTVLDAAFRSSYAPAPDGYRRRGSVRARPGREGEQVATLEGAVVVRAGEWVVEADSGERWTVPAEQFAAVYAPCADDAGAVVEAPAGAGGL